MDNLFYLVGPLGCAVMMAACMAMMARGMRRDGPAEQGDTGDHDEIAALRAQVAELRAERAEQATPIDG
ncbi:MAG TPA: hypothetical protein VM143_06460 [Acidimicrobiales bacterium]|nr:hypothetical protein [Acidimicrobiales bacterium]